MARVIVRRGDLERYERLYKAFGDRVVVLWDRRRADRRQPSEDPPAEERRTRERRGAPQASWRALGFVVTD